MTTDKVLHTRDRDEYQRLLTCGNEYMLTIDGRDIVIMVDWVEFIDGPDGEETLFFQWALVPVQRGLPFALWVVDATPEAECPDWQLLIFNKCNTREKYHIDLNQLVDITGIDEKFASIMADMGW